MSEQRHVVAIPCRFMRPEKIGQPCPFALSDACVCRSVVLRGVCPRLQLQLEGGSR